MKLRRWLPFLLMAAIVGGAFLLGPHHGGHRSTVERARDIAAGVRCPTCGGESALESQAPISQAIRAEIERRLAAGQSDGQIRAYLVTRYGRSILLKPPTSGITGVVWILPLLALAGASIGIARALRRWQARARSARLSEDDRALVEAARLPKAPRARRRASRDGPAGLEEERAQVLTSLAKGLPVITIAASFQKDLQGMMTHDHVKGLDDLKDKTILVATPGRTSWWPWLRRKYGYSDGQTQAYTFNLQPFFVDKNIVQQSYPSSEPFQALQKGVPVNFFLFADDGYPPYGTTMVTTTKFLADHPDVARRFVKASIEALKAFPPIPTWPTWSGSD